VLNDGAKAMDIPLRLAVTDLRVLLDSTVGLMKPQARARDVTLTLRIDPEMPHTSTVDAQKIAWTITALIGNAFRFVRSGTHTMPGGAVTVSAHYSPDENRIVIDVQDDGCGIPRDVLAGLMQESLVGDFRSSGLALALMRDILAAHGGSVQITSSTEPGRSGTTVRLTLPSEIHSPRIE
jgi:signal transduction histidine kinase